MDFTVVEENGRTKELYVLKEEAARKGKTGGQGEGEPCNIKVGLTLDETPPRIILRTMDQNGVSPLVAVLDRESALRIAGALQHVVQRVDDDDSSIPAP